MKDVVYVTGNANKAKYFSELIGLDISHEKVEVPEIQSLKLKEIVSAKAIAAYDKLQRPLIVEDTSLIINELGNLPGPFIKWFIEELGLHKICSLLSPTADRSAIAACAYAYYDGTKLEIFESSKLGQLALAPIGDSGFGWNPIFIPAGQDLTLGEMDDTTFKKYYLMIKPIEAVSSFLR